MNAPTAPSRTARPAAATRALVEFPDLAAKAIEYLCVLSPSFSLAPNEASSVAALMRVVQLLLALSEQLERRHLLRSKCYRRLSKSDL